jgi:glucokinase
MNKTAYYVGLDVGGSTMKAGVVSDDGRPLSGVSLPTEAQRGQEFGLERMCETIRAAIRAAGLTPAQIRAIGVATPGLMDIPNGVILDPPNLRPWRNVPVRSHIAGVFGVPTAFQNDANAAALGEYWVGAGRGVHSLVLFTLGTGVGGGIIWNGKIIEGRHSHGAELGHHKIEMSHPRPCGCGRFGCLEAYASALAVVKRTCEGLLDGSPAAGRSILQGRTFADLTARDVFDAATAGDELAGRIVEETAYYLGIAAMNMMHIIDPDMIVFGGGMTGKGDEFVERIRRHVRELAFPVPAERTRICLAQLGSDAGFIGAAGCGRQLVSEPET